MPVNFIALEYILYLINVTCTFTIVYSGAEGAGPKSAVLKKNAAIKKAVLRKIVCG
jgi:hypothetical protein